MPAQPRRRQVRSVFVSAGAVASMAPIFGPPVGTPRSGHLRKPALAILETQWRTPYHYDLFQGDVGHTLVLGATGAGKSFLLNFLLVQALQYDPRVLILDLGRLLSLAHAVSRRRLYGAIPRRERERRFPVAPLLAPGRGAELPVPHRLDIASVEDRRVETQRRRPQRDFAPASKTSMPLHPSDGPLGCWSVLFPQRCGPLWAVGTEPERGPGTLTTRQTETISTFRTGR